MFDFPKSTEINKFLPKEKIINNLDLNPTLKESLKDHIRRFTITHELSEKSMNIPKGENVSAIFVIEVSLKNRDIDYKLIEAIAKQNPNKILFQLHHDNCSQLALFYGKLYKSPWDNRSNVHANIIGFNFDEVWDNLVAQIALETPKVAVASDISLEEQLANQEEVTRLKRGIDKLEKLARSERQPKKKFEIVGKVNELKKKLEGLK